MYTVCKTLMPKCYLIHTVINNKKILLKSINKLHAHNNCNYMN